MKRYRVILRGAQVLIMGRDLSGAADHDLSPLISSGHITAQPPSTPWRDFLRYIEASRCVRPVPEVL